MLPAKRSSAPAFPKSPDPALHQYLAQDRNAPTHGFCSTEHINSCAQMIQALPGLPQRILWNRCWKQKLRQRLSALSCSSTQKSNTANLVNMTLTRQNDDAPPTLCQMKLELPKFSNTCSLLPHLISPGSKFHILASCGPSLSLCLEPPSISQKNKIIREK